MGCLSLRCFSSAPFDPWKTNLADGHDSVLFQKALNFCNFFLVVVVVLLLHNWVVQSLTVIGGGFTKTQPLPKIPGGGSPGESRVPKHGGLDRGAEIELAPNLAGMGSPHHAEDEQFGASSSCRPFVMSSSSARDPSERGGRGQQDAKRSGEKVGDKGEPTPCSSLKCFKCPSYAI